MATTAATEEPGQSQRTPWRLRFIVTIVMTALAAALAYGAWFYVDDLVRLLPRSPWRGLLQNFGILLSVVTLFVALSLAEMIYAPIASAVERSRMRRRIKVKSAVEHD